LSQNEIVIIAIGLVAGYILVSKFMGNNDSSKKEHTNNSGFDNSGYDHKHGENNSAKSGASNLLWYEILGVDKNASIVDVKKAYRQKMFEYHPDKVASLGKELRELAEQKTKEINSAYAEALKLHNA
jgi:DnaJ-domain-containing protein 1